MPQHLVRPSAKPVQALARPARRHVKTRKRLTSSHLYLDRRHSNRQTGLLEHRAVPQRRGQLVRGIHAHSYVAHRRRRNDLVFAKHVYLGVRQQQPEPIPRIIDPLLCPDQVGPA